MNLEITDDELERRLPGLLQLIEDAKKKVPSILVVPFGMEQAALAFTGGRRNKRNVVATCGICGTKGMAGAKSMQIPGANRVCLICMKILADTGKVPVQLADADTYAAVTAGNDAPSAMLTNVEIQRRIPGLHRVFAEGADDKKVLVINRVCDRELLKETTGWIPSIEHTITTCDVCGDQCWIGPTQAKHVDSSDQVCAVCLALAYEFSGVEPPTPTALNPNEAEIPRRT